MILAILFGLSGIVVLLVAAGFLSITRGRIESDQAAARVRGFGVAAIIWQSIHFFEEYSQGFYIRFPELLGLTPWPSSFFTSFNLAWILICTISAAIVGKSSKLPIFPLWFLALASLANAIAHPLMALASMGYFPGLWTSPISGLLGLLLLRSIGSATISGQVEK